MTFFGHLKNIQRLSLCFSKFSRKRSQDIPWMSKCQTISWVWHFLDSYRITTDILMLKSRNHPEHIIFYKISFRENVQNCFTDGQKIPFFKTFKSSLRHFLDIYRIVSKWLWNRTWTVLGMLHHSTWALNLIFSLYSCLH